MAGKYFTVSKFSIMVVEIKVFFSLGCSSSYSYDFVYIILRHYTTRKESLILWHFLLLKGLQKSAVCVLVWAICLYLWKKMPSY